ncbi:AAA family ATPase [Methylomonas paludis]|uniref:AAA family ATPase n=1 Tax=Methylomonas paludis TaxID=1173101 RepID=A0A975MKX9_9GAMM|nr:ATP-binding protein [Methylomonas paludis]QWF69715.1 AAA family ATPase [Methylomonas paludis]
MLLEFRVRNFRSIRDEIIVSFIASNDKKLAETNLTSTSLKSLSYVVRSAVIYGPNASGKSTILQALNYMRSVVSESATSMQSGQHFNVQPFRLDSSCVTMPTEFEITFLLYGIRYQYGFSLTPEKIIDEWLLVYRAAKPQQWFNRHYDESTQNSVYEFSSHLSGPRKVWQKTTRSNALFLSTAAQFNSLLILPVYRWIVEQLVPLNTGFNLSADLTTALLQSDIGKREICEFLASADISISEIFSVPRQGYRQLILFSPEGPHITSEENEIIIPQFVHKTEKGSATFELHEESIGTQHLYALAAPILDALRYGKLIIVDELDSSLHPLMVRKLVRMFHDTKINKLGAQLLFTTHDTSLLDRALFRSDQIWFTEKDQNQATNLYPLTDFSPRENEAWERGYLIGRYGAVPFFNESN